jgi:hypothetical protein
MSKKKKKKKKKKNSRSKGGPGVNEVSFRTRPHHNVHNTLEIDKSYWPSVEGGLYGRGGRKGEGEEKWRDKII